MRSILNSIRTYTVRGALAVTPIFLTLFVLKFLYELLDRSIIGQFDQILGVHIPGPWVGIGVFVGLLYLVGIIASNVIGRQIFRLIDLVSERIPLVKAIYQVGKQLSSSFSPSDKDSRTFQKVVLIDYFHVGVLSIGFITGMVKNSTTGEELLKVLIPTVPNPITGFVVFAKPSQLIDPKWSVEEGLKIVISGGIIGPERFR